VYDGALPSGNSVAALNFLRLSRMTGNINLEQRAEQLIQAFSEQVADQPMAYTQLLIALDLMVGPGQEIVIVGDPTLESTQAMINAVQRSFLPNKVLLLRSQGTEGKRLASLSPFVEDMDSENNRPTVYVCEKYACKTPITDLDKLKAILN